MFEVDFGPNGGGAVKFKTRTDLNTYFQKQVSDWGTALSTTIDDTSGQFISTITNGWNSLLQFSSQYADPAYDQQVREQVAGYRNSSSLVVASRGDGLKLLEIAKKLGNSAAFGAWQFRTNYNFSSFHGNAAKGAIAYALLDFGATNLSKETLEVAIANSAESFNVASQGFSKDLETKSADLEKLTREKVSAFNALLESSTKSLEKLNSEYATIIEDTVRIKSDQASAIEQHFKDTSKNLQTLRQSFETEMGIEAPVKYWKRKARIHRLKYDAWKETPLVWGVIGMIILAASVALSFKSTNDLIVNYISFFTTQIPNFTVSASDWLKLATVVVGGTTLLLVTLYIWGIRFFLRMMMTEHHLSIDAEARATMAETYLALTKIDGTTTEERQIVLAALFKPVTDGIVRDDGLPTISPTSILTSHLTRSN